MRPRMQAMNNSLPIRDLYTPFVFVVYYWLLIYRTPTFDGFNHDRTFIFVRIREIG
jgi:hypothetical protein